MTIESLNCNFTSVLASLYFVTYNSELVSLNWYKLPFHIHAKQSGHQGVTLLSKSLA